MKLRNYCTHRAIPVPGMVTSLFDKGQPPRLINELKLDMDALLTWNGWTTPARVP